MSLNANGKFQNVKASIEKYIRDNLIATEDLVFDIEGEPFERPSSQEWVEEVILGKGAGIYHRQTSSTTTGKTVPVLLSLNIYVGKTETTKTNRHYEIRDVVANYLKIGTKIDLFDFADDDWTNSLQTMEVRDVVTDRAIPDPDFHRYNYTVEIHWMEQW